MSEHTQMKLYELLMAELIRRLGDIENPPEAPTLNCARQLLKDLGFQPAEPENDAAAKALNDKMKEAMGLSQEDIKNLTLQ